MLPRGLQLLPSSALLGIVLLGSPSLATTAPPPRPGPPAQTLLVRAVSFELDCQPSVGEPQTAALTLALSLYEPLDDWLSVYLRVPDGYRVGRHDPGEWAAFHQSPAGERASARFALRKADERTALVSFPLLVRSGDRQDQLVCYIQTTSEGVCAALALLDPRGEPAWPTPASRAPVPATYGSSYWVLSSSASQALAFIAEVLDITIHVPGRLAPTLGSGSAPDSIETLLAEPCWRCGATLDTIGDREYRVRFADNYRGAPDASWWVLTDDHGFRFRAQDGPAADLLAALLDLAGGTIENRDDIADVTVTVEWLTPSLAQALDFVCLNSLPQLTWWRRDNSYRFAPKDAE